MTQIDEAPRDVLVPLFMVQMPEKSLARRGLKTADWEYVVENIANVKIQKSDILNTFISLESYRQILLMGMRFFGAQEQTKHYIEDIQSHHFGPIGTATITAPTLRDGINVLERFYMVTTPALNLQVKTKRNQVILELQPIYHLDVVQDMYMELVLLAVRKLLISLNPEASDMEINFTHEKVYSNEFYEKEFETCPNFSRNSCYLVLEANWLDKPNENSSPLTYQQAIKECEILVANIQSNHTVSQQVYNMLMKGDHLQHRYSLDMVAEQLSMSARSLSRKLQQEKANFKEIQLKVRIEKAKRELEDTQLSIKNIGYNTGFNNLSSFSRAFRKHTQLTPTEYRSQHCEQ
ncbi:MAG: hypothetical protein COA99_00450 [Moraxellaceae bacterium]|nr:MAG: hypothetical protein COA99_00450 [Moraxellaceae bacterium]